MKPITEFTPQSIVKELNEYIVGQKGAKRAVAVALRNRSRRRKLPPEIRRDITPKNMLMIGPTGVGKTEIARRVAEMIDAPFVKVEATKFTEVGYVGRDVDSIVQDLVDTTVNKLYEERLKEAEEKAERLAAEKLLNYLCQQSESIDESSAAKEKKALSGPTLTGSSQPPAKDDGEKIATLSARGRRSPVKEKKRYQRQLVAELLHSHQLEDQLIEIEVAGEAESFGSILELSPGMSSEEIDETFHKVVDDYKNFSSRRRRRKVPVKEARRILTREEASKLVDIDQLIDIAVERVEESGVVFIDELDKIVGPKVQMGADVSGEGVQRDLLPLLEGSTIMTRYGPVKTDHILFIGAGAFHHSKPSDLIPEIQGRFPLRVELSPLSEGDLKKILVEPHNALTKQYQALLETEGIELVFTDDGVAEIARLAALMNERLENIGARRLHTIMEKVLEEVSYYASEKSGERVIVDDRYVDEHLADFIKDDDLSRYIL